MRSAGYVVLQHRVRLDRPVQAYQRWLDRLPAVYATAVLNHPPEGARVTPADDPHCLAQLRHSRA